MKARFSSFIDMKFTPEWECFLSTTGINYARTHVNDTDWLRVSLVDYRRFLTAWGKFVKRLGDPPHPQLLHTQPGLALARILLGADPWDLQRVNALWGELSLIAAKIRGEP